MINKPKIGIVIPCHNGYLFTKKTLESILNSSYENYKVYVVDDGSTDNTKKNIKENFSGVKVISGNGNFWWSKSMNVGIKKAIKDEADYIFVLNNDVLISHNTLQVLIDCALDNPDAIIGSVIYYSNNKNMIWSAGGLMKWPWPGEIQIGMGEIDKNQYSGVRNVDWLPGMGTLIKVSILQELNYYDSKNLPQYMADCDLCLRAKNNGYKVLISSKSKLYNNVENTGGISNNLNKLSLKGIKEIFTSLRSPDLFKARFKFIYRHCSSIKLFPALAIRYGRLLLFILRRLV
tara:strand:- start:8976 stop:9845 length:870 start_codon:yes stop_codon:yes gene_type:complete